MYHRSGLDNSVGALARKLLGGPVAALALEDGSFFLGKGFGAHVRRSGEIVFSTAMNGYTESLTDPSYVGQILILTYPLIGNYGVPPDFESDRMTIEALVVSQATEPSHPRSEKSLQRWLEINDVPGVMDVDTRMLVKKIREEGVMGCAVQVAESLSEIDPGQLIRMAKSVDYDSKVFEYSTYDAPFIYRDSNGPTVVVVDFGVKRGVLDALAGKGLRVVVVPGRLGADAVFSYSPAGVVISNGPGNPAKISYAIQLTREVIESGTPTLGVCLGHQLIALALGAKTYKMKYGHRGINKGCRDLLTGKRVVTLQNHGYAVSRDSIEGTGLRQWFEDCDEGVIEGLVHESLPLISVQFHPEGRPGPRDASYVFDIFKKMVEENGARK
jgi:carbamoyl-phosphate synthase small subunit